MDMIIVSPFEANCLLSKIQASNFVTLHLYAARQNEVLSSLDKLDLYNVSPVPAVMQVPESLRIQLNLFAGQLSCTWSHILTTKKYVIFLGLHLSKPLMV